MLEQYIPNDEDRERCIDAIGRVMREQDTGHLILVEGKGASGKTLFAQALTDVLRERGMRVNNIVDANFENKDVVDLKEGVVVIYQIHPYTSIELFNDEGLKRRTTTIRLEGCVLGATDVKQALMKDFRRIDTAGNDDDWQKFIARIPKWEDVADEQKALMLSYIEKMFPE